jgi:hypothetical protein
VNNGQLRDVTSHLVTAEGLLAGANPETVGMRIAKAQAEATIAVARALLIIASATP